MDVIVARPTVGPRMRERSDLGSAPRPLFALLAGGRLPLVLPLSLPRKFELSRLLPLLGAPCLEVPPACTGPLLWMTARVALALRAGVHGLPLLRTGHARVLVVVFWERWTTTTLVPSRPWTSSGMILSGHSWPSSGTYVA